MSLDCKRNKICKCYLSFIKCSTISVCRYHITFTYNTDAYNFFSLLVVYLGIEERFFYFIFILCVNMKTKWQFIKNWNESSM